MSLTPSTRLGPYEIIAPLGAGGMGEVYRARDTRLDRTVAVKVLPEGALENPERKARFEREARLLSSLNHPNICALYDVGHQNGIDYLVMEFLEGDTLAARLRSGPLPAREAYRIGAEIAAGLDAAHRSGVVHRDLKPGNIILTRAGTKLLDFGLAKRAAAPAAPEAETVTKAMTSQGTIVGTYPYMAPEQIEGRELDGRTDIFALGGVLYEMFTGKRAFEAGSATGLLAAILTADPPPVSTAQPLAPAALDHLVQTCLAKRPDDRWQTAGDVKRQLEWISQGISERSPVLPPRRAAGRLAWVAAALALFVLAVVAFALWPRETPAPKVVRFQIPEPEGTLLPRPLSFKTFAPSPSGDRFVFIANTMQGPMVFVRPLDSTRVEPLPGTEKSVALSWSDDGRQLAFISSGDIRYMPARGGAPQVLAPVPGGLFPQTVAWAESGTIIVPVRGSGAYRLDPSTGVVSRLDTENRLWAEFLPGGGRYLFVALNSNRDGFRAGVRELSSGKITDLFPVDSRVSYAPPALGQSTGFLVYVRSATLLAQPFDASRLRLAGEPVPLAEKVPTFQPSAAAGFAVSRDVLVYQSGQRLSQLVWFDRSGKELERVGPPADYLGSFMLAPSGTGLAYSLLDAEKGGSDLWMYDLTRKTATRLTSEPFVESAPVWAPDGKEIIYGRATSKPPVLWRKSLSDPGLGAQIGKSFFELPTDWSRDGRWVAFQTAGELGGKSEIRVMPASGKGAAVTLLSSQFEYFWAVFSPDAKWMAYTSSESGNFEVYAVPIQLEPAPRVTGEKRRISATGGWRPRWRPDGRELYYLSADNHLMSVAVNSYQFAQPKALFRLRSPSSPSSSLHGGYDISPDGQRFLIDTMLPGGTPPFNVVVNWQLLLKNPGQ